ncbi:MAG: nucleotidyl transferase AbiEii/AbiGii toxin family protein [Patescibacteria group bacterium]
MISNTIEEYFPVIDRFCELHPDFILVGGTALALQIQHRVSFDFDLFTNGKFDTDFLATELSRAHSEIFSGNILPTLELTPVAEADDQIHFAVRNPRSVEAGTKVTLFKFEFPISTVKKKGNVPLASPESIFAMKLFAILKRVEYKDFYDLAFLIKKFSLKKGISLLDKLTAPKRENHKLVLAQLDQINSLVEDAEKQIVEPKISRTEVTRLINKGIDEFIKEL